MKAPARPKVPAPAGGTLLAWQRQVAELNREIQQIKQWQQQPGTVYGTAQRMIEARITRMSLLKQRIEEAKRGVRTPPTHPQSVERRSAQAKQAMARSAAHRRAKNAFNATVPIDLIRLEAERESPLTQQVASGLAGVVGADPYQDESRAILRKRQQKGTAPTLRVQPAEVGQIQALRPYVEDFLNATRRDYHTLRKQGITPLSVDRLRAYLQQEYAGRRKLTAAQERALPGILAGLQVRWDERVRGAKRVGARLAENAVGVATGGAGLLPRAAAAASAGIVAQAFVDTNHPELTAAERLQSAGTAGLFSAGAEGLGAAWQAARKVKSPTVSPGPVSPHPVPGAPHSAKPGPAGGPFAEAKPGNSLPAKAPSPGPAPRPRPGTRVTVKTPRGARITGEVTRSSPDGRTVYVRNSATGKEVPARVPPKGAPGVPQKGAPATPSKAPANPKQPAVGGPQPTPAPQQASPAAKPPYPPVPARPAEPPAVTGWSEPTPASQGTLTTAQHGGHPGDERPPGKADGERRGRGRPGSPQPAGGGTG